MDPGPDCGPSFPAQRTGPGVANRWSGHPETRTGPGRCAEPPSVQLEPVRSTSAIAEMARAARAANPLPGSYSWRRSLQIVELLGNRIVGLNASMDGTVRLQTNARERHGDRPLPVPRLRVWSRNLP